MGKVITDTDVKRKDDQLKLSDLEIMDELGKGCSVTFFFSYSIPVATQERLARNFIYRRKTAGTSFYTIEVNKEHNFLKLHREK